MILTETDQHTKLLHVQFHIANLIQRLREFNYKCFAIKKSEEKGIYILHLSFQIPVKFHRNFSKYESHYLTKYKCFLNVTLTSRQNVDPSLLVHFFSKENLLEKSKLQKLAEDEFQDVLVQECSGMFRNTYLFTGKLGIEY